MKNNDQKSAELAKEIKAQEDFIKAIAQKWNEATQKLKDLQTEYNKLQQEKVDLKKERDELVDENNKTDVSLGEAGTNLDSLKAQILQLYNQTKDFK